MISQAVTGEMTGASRGGGETDAAWTSQRTDL